MMVTDTSYNGSTALSTTRHRMIEISPSRNVSGTKYDGRTALSKNDTA